MKIEARPFESFWEAGEDVGVREPAASEQVSALAVQEGFCSGSPASPQQGLRHSGNTRFTRLSIFSSSSPSEVLPEGASSSAANEGEGLSQPQVEPDRLYPAPPLCPALGAEPGSEKTSGQPCPSCSQLGNL